MKHCQFCGNQMDDEARFCSKCGLEHGGSQREPVDVEPIAESKVDINAAPPLPDTSVQHYSTVDDIAGEVPPNNGLVWLILSIILTLCCCNLLQIVTIVFAAISMSRHNQGDYEEAKRYARIAMIIFFSLLALAVITSVVSFAFTGALVPDYFSDIVEQFDFT